MKREDLEHIIRAAAEVTGEREFVIVGSQAVLGQFPDPPSVLLVSMEADIHPIHAPTRPSRSKARSETARSSTSLTAITPTALSKDCRRCQMAGTVG